MKRKLVVSLLLVGLLAFGIGAGTFAYFTSQATSGSNSFTAGTLVVEAGAIAVTNTCDIGNIYPGYTDDGSFTVTNSGSLPMKVKITPNISGDLFAGSNPAIIALSNYLEGEELAAGASKVFTFDFDFPAAAGNEYQGATGSVNFTVDATQTNNPGWTTAPAN